MFLVLAGIVAVLYVLVLSLHTIWRVVYTYIIPSFVDNEPYLRSMGKWAVITGASDGIGKEYARRFSQCGINVVLISRSKDKLIKVASEIEETYKVETMIIVADFLNYESIYEDIRKKLSQLDIGFLINNVGMAATGFTNFLDTPNIQKLTEDLFRVNCLSTVMMTYIVLPNMVRKKRGVVINVSSLATCYPFPELSLYGTTKMFVLYLTQCLQNEYVKDGIVFQVLTPSVLSTQMTNFIHSSTKTPTAEIYVRSSFRTIGYASITCGYWPHSIKAAIITTPLLRMVSVAVLKFKKTFVKGNE